MNRLFATLSLLLCLAPVVSHAQELIAQPTGYVGLDLGYLKPSNLQGRFAYEANVGLRMTSGIAYSFFFESSTGSEDNADNQLTHFGVGVDYVVAKLGANGSVWAGGRTGIGTLDTTPRGQTKTSVSRFTLGPVIGYDYMLPNMGGFSVGGESQLLWTFTDATQTNLYIMANAKLWF